MFTGLVESLGRVDRVIEENVGKRFSLTWPNLTTSLAIGESVSVNGCCLTVVVSSGEQFEVQAGPETLDRTNLGQKRDREQGKLRAIVAGRRTAGRSFRPGAY